MRIINGLVHTPDAGFQLKDIYINNGLFTNMASSDEIIDASDCYVIPGLVDIHFHGCIGHDFCDASIESLSQIAYYQLKNGITSICPASMTYDEKRLIKICETAYLFSKNNEVSSHATLRGIHLEGPFISSEKKGAQNPRYIQEPSVSLFQRLFDASHGLVRLITIAPELKNGLLFIEQVSKKVHVSLGHTNCDYETAKKAFSLGADHMTHLYNAMPGLHHRYPGPVGAAINDSNVMVELICDGIHIHPAIIHSTLKLFGPSRVIFISDSMMATGMSDGTYELGGLPVTVVGKMATLHDGTIAGSASNLMDCVRVAVSMGIPLDTAVTCASLNAAKSIALDHIIGSIEPSKIADCVLLSKKDLSIKEIIHQGIRI